MSLSQCDRLGNAKATVFNVSLFTSYVTHRRRIVSCQLNRRNSSLISLDNDFETTRTI
ncbi:hypothetical protein BU25DRAFT_230630 [Macroventuria anomochaeta]|uniref:Uncharacterized protein n=1 Tax=Macroventuria anomochaeta TaxID=301207 RepID=A0ACB6RIN9_9PLEO|nr:uncharacterized protein BU25DRAFT_230630 [Macroventuria anomochaeta]KAF2621766.1 hypothetical protein BU25DRAFT_230630 [Macroventuria anomochaeta]